MQMMAKKKGFLCSVLVFLLSMTFFLGSCGLGGGINKANYDKIQNGMSFDEVVSILGDDYEVSSDSGYGGYSASCYVWESYGKVITVIFLNGRVYSKAQSGL